MKLEEKVSEKPRAIDPQKSVVHEPVVDVPLPSRRSGRVSRSPERYMGMLTEKVKEIFLMGDKIHSNDPATFNGAISDIDFEK